MMTKPLLLRPLHKAQSSVQYFANAGITIETLSLLSIQVQPAQQQAMQDYITGSALSLTIIITSTSAAQLTCQHVALPKQHKYYAIGETTAKILQQHGVNVAIPKIQTSEGLVNLLIQQKAKQPMVLIKGEGGRSILPAFVANQGEQWHSFDVYQRQRISVDTRALSWNTSDIESIITTSCQQTEWMFQQFDSHWLRSLPWIAVSQRSVAQLNKLGVNRVCCSDGATDEQLVEAVHDFRSQQ